MSKKPFTKVLNILEENEEPLGLMRLLNVYWDAFVAQNNKATGTPASPEAARKWLLKRAGELRVSTTPSLYSTGGPS